MRRMSGTPSPPRWFDRRFDGRIALELHPNVKARLHGVAARVEEATRGLSRAALTRRNGAAWSIQTNAGQVFGYDPRDYDPRGRTYYANASYTF